MLHLPQLCIAVAVFLTAASLAAAERPNIVFLISDDHDYEHFGFMGNQTVQTPALDRLARNGTVFTTAHLPMSRCHPTLSSFLSGVWPHQSQIYFNFGKRRLQPENSLPNLLKDAGYATFLGGKYWDGNPQGMGFSHGGKSTQFVRKGQESVLSFIDQTAGKQPMFIWWAPKLPHLDHNPPSTYVERYDASRIPLPSYIRRRSPEELRRAEQAEDTPRNRSRRLPGAVTFRRWELLSYAMVSWLDDGVRDLVDKLESVGQHENTLYAFVADNGWCNGLPSKGSVFEKGLRTPIVLSWPGKLPRGQRLDPLVSTLDLYPTLLDYAGVSVPGSAAGRSLRPALEGSPSGDRTVLYGAVYPARASNGENAAEDVYALYARTARWKYVYYLKDVRDNAFTIYSFFAEFPERDAGEHDLYDLRQDPYEEKDLAEVQDHQKLVENFHRDVIAWWERTGGGSLSLPSRPK